MDKLKISHSDECVAAIQVSSQYDVFLSKMQHNYLPSKAKMRGIVILSTYTRACLVFYHRVRSNYAISGTPMPLQYGEKVSF